MLRKNKRSLSCPFILWALGLGVLTACEGGKKTGADGGQGKTPGLHANRYLDVRNLETGEMLATDRFPSQLNFNKNVPACRSPEVFWMDKCWDEITVNADEMTVVVTQKETGESSRVFDPNTFLPDNVLKGFEVVINPISKMQNFGDHLFYALNTKYYYTPCDAQGGHQTIEYILGQGSFLDIPYVVWGIGKAVSYARTENRNQSTPWVSADCFATATKDGSDQEKIVYSGIKSTFAFGSVQSGTTGETVAHKWDYKGKVIIQGVEFSLPIKMSDLASLPARTPIQGYSAEALSEHYLKNQFGYVLFKRSKPQGLFEEIEHEKITDIHFSQLVPKL